MMRRTAPRAPRGAEPHAFACSFALAAIAALAVGCGGGAASEQPAASPPGAPAAGPVAAAPAGPPMPPVGTVKGIAVSNKADHFTRVTVAFNNPGGTPCKIASYTLTWPGGRKTIPLDNFVVGPGATEIRAIRVHTSDGDITNLTTVSETKVELESDCGK